MAEYEYDNLPDNMTYVSPVPESLVDDAREAFFQALNSNVLKVEEIKAAHVYRRSNSMSMDTLGSERNASYGSKNDDIVMQVTIRVPAPAREESLSKLVKLEEDITEINRLTKIAEMEAEIAEAEAAASEAAENARKKREQLENLRSK